MPHPTGSVIYPYVRSQLDRAIENPRGLRLTFPTHKEAYTFRQQAYAVRTRDRKNNRKIYSEDHPLHGASVYDELTFLWDPEDPERCKLLIVKGAYLAEHATFDSEDL